ncbi:MAG TPA: nucleotidyltransferase domain-containing protein [Gaiellaceae bacterium]
MTEAQRRLVEAAVRWADDEPRVQALVLKGSLARERGDELSDVDLVVVTEPGERESLWAEREEIAAVLGDPMGVFREAAWATPYMVIALYDGPQKLDLAFEDGSLAPDPWLRDGYEVLAGALDEEPDLSNPPPFGPEPDLRELDAHAWDWAFWIHVKLERGENWIAWFQLASFLEHIVVLALNALRDEAWMGPRGIDERFSTETLADLEAARPRAPEPEALRSSLLAAADLYAKARRELKARYDPELPDNLMRQVLAQLRGGSPTRV